MKRLLLAFALSLVTAVACSKSSPASPSPTLQGIAISGTASIANKSQTSQLTLTSTLSDGTTQNVTASAAWTSASATIATVSSAGVVTAVANGTSTITATYQGKTATLVVTVAMRATLSVTPFFSRLCTPFRAGMDVTITESSNNMGMTVTQITITMTDLNHFQRFTRTYSAAEISALLSGGNHFNAGQSKVFSVVAAYPGNVETEDSTGYVSVLMTDDAGNAAFVTLTNVVQHDRC